MVFTMVFNELFARLDALNKSTTPRNWARFPITAVLKWSSVKCHVFANDCMSINLTFTTCLKSTVQCRDKRPKIACDTRVCNLRIRICV